jgi:hypothetical protein
VPAPFIDRLSVVATFPEGQCTSEAHNSVLDALADKGHFVPAKGGKFGPFKLAYNIVSVHQPVVGKWALFQYAHAYGKPSKVRIDMVPVDLGPLGLAEVNEALKLFLPGGWRFFIENGSVTRIDISVDFQDIRMNQFLFLPSQLATTKQWSSKGELQTYQHGKVDGNHTQIYSRKAKRAVQGKAWQGKEGIRVERRLKNPGIQLSALPGLPNAFASISMVQGLPDQPPATMGENWIYIWKLFKLAANSAGLEVALGVLPEERRKLFKHHIEKVAAAPWWDVDAIWSGWKPMLEAYRICDKKSWK